MYQILYQILYPQLQALLLLVATLSQGQIRPCVHMYLLKCVTSGPGVITSINTSAAERYLYIP